MFHTGGVGLCLQELRHLKRPAVHPIPAVFGEKPTAAQLCPLQNPHALPCESPGVRTEKTAISRLSYIDHDAVGT
jgi:hypothetical protein